MAQNIILGRDSTGTNHPIVTHTDGKLLIGSEVAVTGMPASVGAKTASASLPVTLATDDVLTTLLPASVGAKTASASLAVTLATDDVLTTLLPASVGAKTASASLAVTLATDDVLTTLLPASIGQKAKNASLAVTLASDDVLVPLLPASIGQKAKDASLAVTLATDEDTLNVASSASKDVTIAVSNVAFTAGGEYGDADGTPANAINITGKTRVLVCGYTDQTSSCPAIHLVGYSEVGTQADANRRGFSTITATAQDAPSAAGDLNFYYNQVFENVGWEYIRLYTDTASTGATATIEVITF